MMDTLRKYLTRPRVVKWQVLFYLYAARVMVPVSRFYNTKYVYELSDEQPKSSRSAHHILSQPDVSIADFPPYRRKRCVSHEGGSQGELSTRQKALITDYQRCYQKPISETYLTPNRSASGRALSLSVESKSKKKHGQSSVPRPVNISQWHDYAWKGIPRVHPALKWHNAFSTTYMTYIMIRNILPIERMVQFIFNPSLPARCYQMGRVAPKMAISGQLAMVCAGCHLCWRVVQHLTNYHSLQACMFLLQSDQDVARYSNHLNIQYYLMAHGPAPADDGYERPVERLFRAVISFPISYGLHQVNKCRPNRTPEARDRLRRRLVNSFIMASITMIVLFLTVGSLVIFDLITDKAYVRAYPKCSPEIDDIVKNGNIGLFHVTITWHKVVSAIWAFSESALMWIETGIALFFVVPLGYLANYDLYLYWIGLEEKLKSLFNQMQVEHELELAHSKPRDALIELKNEVELARDRSMSICEQPILVNRIELCEIAHIKSQNRETQIHELQAELADFFHQLKSSDRFISDNITMGIVIWPVGFCVFSYIMAVDQNMTNTDSKFVVGFSTLVVSFTSILFCSMERRIARSYRMLCSITAHDNSRYKRKFLPVLDFYTLKKFTYTIFREYPYSLFTLFTVMGWTISCIIVITNLSSQINGFRPLVSYWDYIY